MKGTIYSNVALTRPHAGHSDATLGKREHSGLTPVLVTLIAVSICRARTFSFCIRTKQLPLDVKALFGGYHPSIGHGIRVCKILRSEWHRQERTYRDALHVQLQLTDLTPGVKKRRWREYCDRIEYTANRLWSRELASLRAQRPTKPRQSGVVHSCSDVVHNTLALGPKFVVDRGRSTPELLSKVRSVAGHASPEDSDRCISEGVNVLLRGTAAISRFSGGRALAEDECSYRNSRQNS
ncbi:hypothetical protein HPB51_002815 [Rhipicephalus microplus]|uniref:Tick transposon n=1 Tax=Rhipicephalus microplus TaxID=6941 RepID=A0A9J6EWV1_RHIMP|nr:hypothetical protein HPB51_002815 [Rhipicephalus microplus]